MNTSKILPALVIAGGVAATALVGPTTATAATLADCTGSTNHQNLSSGFNSLNSGAPIRSGPNASCSVRGTGPAGVALHCWAKNEANNIWWFVNISGQATQGWVHEPNMYYTVVRHESNRCRV
ncbi:hypothetical protein [Kribbella sp. CA-293567]|uniref:hypothetical protein n=1 Tax=Kribbella sp. CA-293567 TaxID=3002436 RepID=UPI0022DDEB71|nr:hypothetical protein [Kribbella sp. CA-293567]WBQ03319.1 hypothetical protein OX958_25475 [Kribbella sp. CA-293567]